ncbi:DNA methyltransferase [Candidatus Poseidoniaceae archaeon]|nr:DNA methyltransferase [Candidatus Poseidoniaceae archaeon]
MVNIQPIQYSVKAKTHSAPYQMHKYYARRPYNVFRNLIEHYSKPGDLILDCFCGGGVTLLEGLTVDRKIIAVDLNPLATFITKMQIQQIDIDSLEEYFSEFRKICEDEYSKYYFQKTPDGEQEVDWVEYIYEVECPKCESSILLSEENKVRNGYYTCNNSKCESNLTQKGLKRTDCRPISTAPSRLSYTLENDTKLHNLSQNEKIIISQAKYDYTIHADLQEIDIEVPSNWDRWHEDCLPQKGVHRFPDFFTEKNYFINVMIFNKILAMDKSEFRDLLYFAFSSSLRYTNKMSRVVQDWEGGNPTCMDKHAYWLPNIFVETNILHYLKKRMGSVVKGMKYIQETIPSNKKEANSFEEIIEDGDYMILNQSSSRLSIPSESISAVITDPPYGSNVQYGELSAFWNVWLMQYLGLDNFQYLDEEAISNRKLKKIEGKNSQHYEDMLFSIFSEANRVLKPNGYLVFTFNNKDIDIWVRMLRAVVKSGFILPRDGLIYQKYIKGYENTAHLKSEGNIQGDYIYSFIKGSIAYSEDINLNLFETELTQTIHGCVEKLFLQKSEYNTPTLYQYIFSEIVSMLMKYLHAEQYVGEKVGTNLTKTSIDKILELVLNNDDHIWTLKDGD